MNGAYTLFDFPYVFQGTDGGVFDVWLEDPLNGGHYPGGGFSSGSVWDPTSNSRVALPDRYYAINGSATPGVATPTDHWHQRFLRINLLARGEGGSPTVQQTLSAVVPDVSEGIAYETVQMLEAHDLTGANRVPAMAWNGPTPTAPDDFSAVVRFMDGLVNEFAITGTGGSSALDQGYVWFNPTNEPWGNTAGTDGCPPTDYFDTQTFWIERLRNHHRAENLIVIDLSEWGQDLWGLAHGCYDEWWQSLADHSSGDLTRNVVLSWHAYGSRRPALGQPYSYITMDADLAAATAMFPLMIGEYGQPVGQGVNYAGPWQWNVDAVTWLATDDDGPGLIEKHGLPAAVWTATGDSSYGHSFKLVQGPERATDDYRSTPFWDIESGDDLRLERLGRAHWDLAHRLWP